MVLSVPVEAAVAAAAPIPAMARPLTKPLRVVLVLIQTIPLLLAGRLLAICSEAIVLGVRVATRMCSIALRLDSSAYWHRAGNWGTHHEVVGA